MTVYARMSRSRAVGTDCRSGPDARPFDFPGVFDLPRRGVAVDIFFVEAMISRE